MAKLSSKKIGITLNISPKTLKNHAWIMERIGTRKLADLIRDCEFQK